MRLTAGVLQANLSVIQANWSTIQANQNGSLQLVYSLHMSDPQSTNC